MTNQTQLEYQRQKAIEILLQKTDKTIPTLIDYHIDDWTRSLLDLPARPNGQDPYEGWIIGEAKTTSKGKKTSETGIELIKKWEGCRLNAYLCPANVWTIGYGHTAGVKKGDEITYAEANKLLKSDLEHYEKAVNDSVTAPLNQNQFDALVLFTYNVGVGAFQKSTLLRTLNHKNYRGAAQQFKRWVKAGKKTLPGLVSRRKDEEELFLS